MLHHVFSTIIFFIIILIISYWYILTNTAALKLHINLTNSIVFTELPKFIFLALSYLHIFLQRQLIVLASKSIYK